MVNRINHDSAILPSNESFHCTSALQDKIEKVCHKTIKVTSLPIKQCPFEGCSKRIPLAMQEIICKCGSAFCKRHWAISEHCCPFNWKEHHQEVLRNGPNCNSKQVFSPNDKHDNCSF